MKIKSKLTILVCASLVAIGSLYGYIILITLDIDRELDQIEKIECFEGNISQLGLTTEYYLTQGDERYLDAWFNLISELDLLHTEIEDFRQYNIVAESLPSIRGAFELIADIYTTPGLYPDEAARDELLQRASIRIRSDVRQLMIITARVAAKRVETIRTLQVDQRLDFLFVLIPAILLVLLIAFMIRRQIISSLYKLTEGTKRLSAGNFDTPIHPDRNDELGELAKQFNKMALQLQQRIESEKELTDKLESKALELEESNRELEQFAYTASHDLKEPLRMIRNFMELLEKNNAPQLDDKAKKYLHFATDGAQRMNVLIDDLLEYSRISRIYSDFETVDMEQLVDSVIDLYEAKIEDKKAIVKRTKLPRVAGTPVSLKLVFQNLLSNALKYHEKDNTPKVEIRAEDAESHWAFSVSDNGIGIDEKYFDEIFLLFKRLHSKGKYAGTGMGLAMCKKVIEQHGGEIWVSSEKGEGTTFYFTIKKDMT